MPILGDLSELIVDCEHKTAPTQAEGFPSIRTPNIGRGYLILEGVNRVSEETYRLWTRRAVPREGDLIMAREAPVGNVAMVPPGLQPCLGQRTLLIRPSKDKVDSQFLTYLLLGDQVQGVIHAKTNGATVPHLNMSDVRSLPLPALPSLYEQRRIAGILSRYDDLIENNRRRVKILEDKARALYREWFVHFRYPGWKDVPMATSPSGPAPTDWASKPLEELIATHIGGGWGRDTTEEGYTAPAWVLRGTDIPAARTCDVSGVPHRYHSSSNLRSRRLCEGDIIFEVSGGSKGQPVGRSLLVSEELLGAFHGADVICASFCKRIVHAPEVSASWLWLSLLEGYESGEIEQFQVQSTGISNFKWTEYIVQTHRSVPPEPLAGQFESIVAPMLRQIGVLGRMNATLRRTRDLLLPRLVGET
jgi:type I restriction enzyme, S subunit